MSVTLALVILTVIVSLVALNDRRIFAALLFDPFLMHARTEPWRWITHGFVHGGGVHLFVNMYVLWMFGANVETAYAGLIGGPPALPFLALYLGGIVLSSLPGYFKHRHDPGYRSVGASGATSAVVFAFILLDPSATLRLLLLPFPMPSWIFGLLYLAYEWYMSKRGQDGIAHDAHYFGALYGIGFTAVLMPEAVPHLLRTMSPGLA